MRNTMEGYQTINDWIVSPFYGERVVCFRDEMGYYLIRFSVDIMLLIPFLVLVIAGRLFRLFRKMDRKKRMFFGTHPVVLHLQNKKVLEKEYECTLFVFEDWSNGGMHEGLTLHSIMPSVLIGNQPYLLGSYWVMLWVLYRFDIVHLYFDGGVLERTLWWRIEPWLYQWYGIKTVMYPYGADTMSVSHNAHRIQKLGHMQFRKRYFLLDPKREVRNFWWCKYADLVIGYAPYIDFLPRLDVLVWHGQIVNDIVPVDFPSVDEEIRIVHYASHGIRKSSGYICEQLQKLSVRYPYVRIECLSGLHRAEAIQKLDEAHIFIDSLNDGYLQFSSLEAMLKGKIVLSAVDEGLERFFTYLAPKRYEMFFRDIPLVRIDHESFFETVEAIIMTPELLRERSEYTRAFAEKLVEKNKESYRQIITMVAER